MERPPMTIQVSDAGAVIQNVQKSANLFRRLNLMRAEGIYCDVIFDIPQNKDSNNPPFIYKAHSCIVAASSELLSDVLAKDAKVKNVFLKSFTHDTLSACLDYMYGQEIEVEFDQVGDLKKAADILKIKQLSLHCEALTKYIDKKTKTANSTTPKSSLSDEDIKEEVDISLNDHSYFSSQNSESGQNEDMSKVIHGRSLQRCNDSQENDEDRDISNGSQSSTISPEDIPKKSSEQNCGTENSLYQIVPKTEINDELNEKSKYVYNRFTPGKKAPPKTPLASWFRNYCKSGFRRPSHVIRRETYVLENSRVDDRLPCDHCDKLFKHKESLRRHKRRVAIKERNAKMKEMFENEKQSSTTYNDLNTANESSSAKLDLKHDLLENGPVRKTVESSIDDRSSGDDFDKNDNTRHSNTSDAGLSCINAQSQNSSQNPTQTDEEKAEEKRKNTFCEHCNRYFSTVRYLRRHKERVAKAPDPYHPTLMGKTLTDEEKHSKILAYRSVYYKKEFKCTECDMVFKGRTRYYIHRSTVHRKEKFICKYCNRVFPYGSSLKLHEKRHTQTKDYICTRCDYSAVTLQEIDEHEKSKHGNLKFFCSQCPAVKKTKRAIQRHERLHSRTPIQCEHCDYIAYSKTNMKTHVTLKHLPTEERVFYPCRVCGKDFTTKGHRNRHIKDVHNIEPPRASQNRSRLALDKQDEDDEELDFLMEMEHGRKERKGQKMKSKETAKPQKFSDQSLDASEKIVSDANQAVESVTNESVSDMRVIIQEQAQGTRIEYVDEDGVTYILMT